MCPRCRSRANRHPDDPEYIWCYNCGEVPRDSLITLPYVMHASQRRTQDPATLKNYSTCAGCGVEIETRSKRCKNCAGKGARV